MVQKIEHESKAAKTGKDARIIIKVNQSYRSRDYQITLFCFLSGGQNWISIIRGICGLVPGAKGLSENIRVEESIGQVSRTQSRLLFSNLP